MNVTPKPSLAPEHQRLIETVRSAVLDVGHEGADLAVHHPTALAALDALALKLARLEKLEEALQEARKDIIAIHYAGFDSERRALGQSAIDRLDAALAAREEEAT